MDTIYHNVDILEHLLKIPNKSGEEDKIRDYVTRRLIRMGVEFTVDKVGNIYAHNSAYREGEPTILLNAHLDSINEHNTINPYLIYHGEGIISSHGAFMGADDKCGIFAILELLKDNSAPFKALLTVGEEVGGTGIRHAIKSHEEFFDDIIFNFTIDRMGGHDFIVENHSVRYMSRKLAEVIESEVDQYGYEYETGIYSDANVIASLGVNSCNISCGYYNPHTPGEIIKLDELYHTIDTIPKLSKFILSLYAKSPEIFEFDDYKKYEFSYYECDDYSLAEKNIYYSDEDYTEVVYNERLEEAVDDFVEFLYEHRFYPYRLVINDEVSIAFQKEYYTKYEIRELESILLNYFDDMYMRSNEYFYIIYISLDSFLSEYML